MRNKRHIQRLKKMGILAGEEPMEIPPLSVSFLGPPQVIGDDDDDVYSSLPDLFGTRVIIEAILEEIPQGPYIHQLEEGEDIANWSSVPIRASSLGNE